MIIDRPVPEQTGQLRALWKQTFGDTDAFLDSFFTHAFSSDRCRCVTEEGRVAAALYWFDCSCRGQKLAYLYAVATDKAMRHRGLCRALMENTHRVLKRAGYFGAVLVPGGEDLFRLYEKLGYKTATFIQTFTAEDGGKPLGLRRITKEQYALLRREYLPEGGVVQEGAALALLEAWSGFYAADGVLLAAAWEDGELVCSELLGPAQTASGILQELGIARGRFRGPGGGIPFSMFLPLREDAVAPSYFGLALD